MLPELMPMVQAKPENITIKDADLRFRLRPVTSGARQNASKLCSCSKGRRDVTLFSLVFG